MEVVPVERLTPHSIIVVDGKRRNLFVGCGTNGTEPWKYYMSEPFHPYAFDGLCLDGLVASLVHFLRQTVKIDKLQQVSEQKSTYFYQSLVYCGQTKSLVFK